MVGMVIWRDETGYLEMFSNISFSIIWIQKDQQLRRQLPWQRQFVTQIPEGHILCHVELLGEAPGSGRRQRRMEKL